MGLSNRFTDAIKEVDVIIAGGGSAGCAVAGRLAAAAPNLQVLLIEGGRDNYKAPLIVNPFAFMKHMEPEAGTALFFVSPRSDHVGGREVVVPTGGVLGGGSSINFLMYTRGHQSDFESWKTPGWTADDMLRLMKKTETYHGDGLAKYHGDDGPIHVSGGTYRNEPLTQDYISAMNSLGFPEVKDLQDLETIDAVSKHLRTVNKAGDRSDAAHGYIHPLLRDGEHPNLHVLVEHNVSRVLFDDDNKAIGVDVVPNPLFNPPPTSSPTCYTIKTRLNTVVLSAGALSTPSILERSGIGNKSVLEQAGVHQRVDLPAVGQNLQDHHMGIFPFRSNCSAETTANFCFAVTIDQVPEYAERYAADGRRGWNCLDAVAKLRPTAREVEKLGPAFEEAWKRDFASVPGRGLAQFCLAAGFPAPSDPNCEYIGISCFTLYPYSRGSVHITGPETIHPPAFDSGFFSSPFDVTAAMWMYKKSRDVARRMESYRGEVAFAHPAYPEGSGAAALELPVDGPSLVEQYGGTDKVPAVEYSAEDDAALEAYMRATIATTWHSLGTARMGPRDGDGEAGPKGAVDADLNVYGVTGLKVIDLSIVPENIGGNTNMTAIAIGEKGAEILMRELVILKTA